MAKDSSFITCLRKEWDEKIEYNPERFNFNVIAGERDEFVGTESSLDPFPKNLHRVIQGNHLEIVKPDSAKSLNVEIVLKGLRGLNSEICVVSKPKIINPKQKPEQTEIMNIKKSNIDKRTLRIKMADTFDLEDLELICSNTQQALNNDGIKFRVSLDEVGGKRKENKILNLIEHLFKKGYLHYLTEAVEKECPEFFF